MALLASKNLTTLRLNVEKAQDVLNDVNTRLAAKEAEIASLRDAQEDLSLAVVQDEPGAKEKHSALGRQIEQASADARLLQSAQRKASTAVQVATAERIAVEQKERIERVDAFLAERDAAGAELAKHIALADLAFQKLFELTEKARMAFVGSVPKGAFLMTPNEILHHVELEIFRLASQEHAPGLKPERQCSSFPGGKFFAALLPGFRPQAGKSQASQVPPLVERLAQARAACSAIMLGKRDVNGVPFGQAEPDDDVQSALPVDMSKIQPKTVRLS